MDRQQRADRPSAWPTALVRQALAALLVALGAAAAGHAQTLTPDEQARFLASARVVTAKALPKGVTRPMRLTLSDGRLTHDAVFSSVEERVPVMRFPSGRTELDFVDSYRFSIAAYRLAAILGLDDMVPVTVERRWDGRQGAISWWVDAMFDEQRRRRENRQPPDRESWARQLCRMRIFAQLVADTDRNQSNLLITADWKLWMVDFTRAFRRTKDLLSPGDITRVDRRLLERLRALRKSDVEAAAGRWIGGAEIEAVMARRDRIVARLDELIAHKGETAVVFE